jgi:hypothetical protein
MYIDLKGYYFKVTKIENRELAFVKEPSVEEWIVILICTG